MQLVEQYTVYKDPHVYFIWLLFTIKQLFKSEMLNHEYIFMQLYFEMYNFIMKVNPLFNQNGALGFPRVTDTFAYIAFIE